MPEPNKETWEALGAVARERTQFDRTLLRASLGDALRHRGYAAVVVEDDQGAYGKTPSQRSAALFVGAVVWGVGFAAVELAGLSLGLGFLGGVLAFPAVGVLLPGDSKTGALALFLAWLALGIATVANEPLVVFLFGFVIPLAVWLIHAVVSRALRLKDAQDAALAVAGVIRAAPLIAPVVLLVMFLPALSADVWKVANDLTLTSLAVTAVLSVGLVFAFVRIQLGNQVEPVLAERAVGLAAEGDRGERTRIQARSALSDEGTAVLDEIADGQLDDCWPDNASEYVPYLAAAQGRALQAPLTGRLLVTVLTVAVGLTVYIYLLCAAVVPGSLAAEWTGAVPSATEVSSFGQTVTFHGGAYVRLACLLGIAATSAFLSFVLIEDRFARAITDALLRDPSERFLALALPYLRLRDEAVAESASSTTSTASASD